MKPMKRWLRRQLLGQVHHDLHRLTSEVEALREENAELKRRLQKLDPVAREGRRLGRASARSLETLMQRELLLRRDVNEFTSPTAAPKDVQ